MVNALLEVVLLAEIHHDLVPEELAVRLFGTDEVQRFSEKYPALKAQDGYLGSGSRIEARKRRKVSESKRCEAKRLARYFRYVPWVRFAGLTGSVAYGNARDGDDMDIFLIVARRRLWLTRIIEQVVYRLLRVRRSFHSPHVQNTFCVNFYLSEDRLNVHDDMEDICTALELAVMQPLYHEEYYPKLLFENRWIGRYFPELSFHETNTAKRVRFPVIAQLLDLLDCFMKWAQIAYMHLMGHQPERSHMTADAIEFFYRDAWEKRKESLNKKLKLYRMN